MLLQFANGLAPINDNVQGYSNSVNDFLSNNKEEDEKGLTGFVVSLGDGPIDDLVARRDINAEAEGVDRVVKGGPLVLETQDLTLKEGSQEKGKLIGVSRHRPPLTIDKHIFEEGREEKYTSD